MSQQEEKFFRVLDDFKESFQIMEEIQTKILGLNDENYNEFESYIEKISNLKYIDFDKIFKLFELIVNGNDKFDYLKKFNDKYGYTDQCLEEIQRENLNSSEEYAGSSNFYTNLFNVIKNDNILEFQNIASQTNFQLDEPLFHKLYYFKNSQYKTSFTIIEAAAMNGSINIFKYCFSNLNLQRDNNENLGKFAIIGDNFDIIHILDQYINPSSALTFSILYHKMDLFNYFLEKTEFTVDNLITSISSCNYIVMNMYISNYSIISRNNFFNEIPVSILINNTLFLEFISNFEIRNMDQFMLQASFYNLTNVMYNLFINNYETIKNEGSFYLLIGNNFQNFSNDQIINCFEISTPKKFYTGEMLYNAESSLFFVGENIIFKKLLDRAIENGNIDLLKYFLSHPIVSKSSSLKGIINFCFPLVQSLRHDKYECFLFLLEYTNIIDINFLEYNLYFATTVLTINQFKFFIEKCKDMIHLNAYIRFLTFNKGNYTVLHELCKSNRIEFVQLLINLDNIDVNIQDSFLQTPLHVAAFHHFNDLVEILIRSQKCNYDIVDKCGVYIIFIS